MSEQYAAPESELIDSSTTSELVMHPPRSVSAGRGLSWLGEGFEYFKASPGQWILTCIVGIVVSIVLSIIPLVNMLTMIITYVWIGGLIMGVKAQHDGEPFNVKYLFACFSYKLGPLIGLSAIVMIVNLALMAVLLGSIFMSMMTGAQPDPEALGKEFLVKFLIYMALIIPVAMAAWFAPALIVLHDQGVFSAMKLSFAACLKNIVPFLLYGIVAMLLAIVATIPVGLGWLVVGPMIFASFFTAYKDIFID